MELKVFNTLTSKKEVFKPIIEHVAGMYVCGPTVYGEPHLGHARSAITFDVVFRTLLHLGYKVRYVRNITDVGHLEDEQNDAGEDKILKKARIEQLEPMEVAQQYTNMYRDAMHALNVKDPSIEPTASGHIPEQIETIAKILENGLAYETNGSVYFDVNAYINRYHYGQLSGRILEELQAASRENLEGTGDKRFHADFALWKKAAPEHLMQWPSPWGHGFPGWHIECTAMSSKYLGIPFDIHGGGMDLKFPHHEAEICQSLAAYDSQPVNYWLHNNMVTLNGQKMAKSKGNFITLDQMFGGNHPLLEKAYSPMVIRFYMLQAHYGSPIDFSNQSLQAAENALKKLERTLELTKYLVSSHNMDIDKPMAEKIQSLCNQCEEHICDDFNTAKLIATLFDMSVVVNTLTEQQDDMSIGEETLHQLVKTFTVFLRDVLGIKKETVENNKLTEVIDILLTIRNKAKADKNYVFSDYIRNKLEETGIIVKDGKDGKVKLEIN